MVLCHTDRQVSKSDTLQCTDFSFCLWCIIYAISAIDLPGNRFDLFFYRALCIICKFHVAFCVTQAYYFFCQFFAAGAAFCPYLGKRYVYAQLLAFFTDQTDLCFRVSRETVDCYYCRKLKDLRNIFYMFQKIRDSLFQGLQIFFLQVCLCYSAIIFQRFDRCYNNHCRRTDS